MRRETRYARSGDVNIAYQVIGDGPFDLVFVMVWVSHLDYFWEGPSSRFLDRLASFSRLIVFDKRGTGLSDRVATMPTMDERMDDVRAVMDAAGSERAVLLGISRARRCARCSPPRFPSQRPPWSCTAPTRNGNGRPTIHGRPRRGSGRRSWMPSSRDGVVLSTWTSWLPARSATPLSGNRWATYLQRSASPGAALALPA